MTRPLVTYGALLHWRTGKQHRIIVATTTKKAAYEAMEKVGWHGSYKLWCEYSSDTGNKFEVETATSKPGTVFIDRNPVHTGDPQWEELA